MIKYKAKDWLMVEVVTKRSCKIYATGYEYCLLYDCDSGAKTNSSSSLYASSRSCNGC